MKVVAWFSALMICCSLSAAFHLEELASTGQAERAPALWNEVKQTVGDGFFELLRRAGLAPV